MLDRIKSRLPQGLTEKLPQLSPSMAKLWVPGALIAAIALALFAMLATTWSENYRPLFGARENVSVADVVGVLETEGVAYRLHPESGQVLVEEAALAKARMLLAAKGVTAKLPEGLELMDRNDPLGVSQFVQDVRFRRGLEGELARSIGTLDAVQSARVHLSIARSSSFVVNTGDKSSASVVLQLKPGRQIQKEQIAAIMHMVASSVSGLDVKNVTLTDQKGNFLSARLDLEDGFDPLNQDSPSHRISEEIRNNAQELLNAAVGAGRFRVTVTADVSQDRTEETYEKYAGDPKVLSEATREENERSAGAALGIPGSLSNRPVNVGDDKKDAQGNFRAALSRSYAYDRSVVQVKRGKGGINKLHVAVVLDEAAAPQGAEAWNEEALARVDKLLRVGLGIDAARGDQLAVSSMAFAAPEPAQVWWKDPAKWWDGVVLMLMIAVAGVLSVLLWKLVSAVIRNLGGKDNSLSLQQSAKGVIGGADAKSGQALALAGGAPVALGAEQVTASGMVPLMENVDLPPHGSEVDVMVEHLRTLAGKEPERVAEVVKQWVQKHNQPASKEN